MILRKKIFTFFIIFLLTVSFVSGAAFADPTPTPDTSKAQQDLQNRINELQAKIRELQGQGRTLSSQIGVMDNQIKLTELRINATKQQIVSISEDIETATKKIESLEEALKKLTKVLMNRIVATYEVGTTQPFYVLLTSENPQDFLTRLSYLKIAQENDKKLIFATQQAKNDYVTQKNIFEDKKKKVEALKSQLEAYTTQLNREKEAKKVLLAQTQGDEENYQRLLAEARAQLAGFSRFVSSLGGATILTGQTSCDGWGCYYNQRDSQWGNTLINNAGSCGFGGVDEPCRMASYGCLITSVAMVLSHMGYKVSPGEIAQSSGSNFSVGTAMLKYTIDVNGLNIRRTGIYKSQIDEELKSRPLIVGINAYGGTHFVVLKSGANGDYVMNDPFVAGGKDVSFNSHYSFGSIFEVDKVSVN